MLYSWEQTLEALHDLRNHDADPHDGICLEYTHAQTGGPVLPTIVVPRADDPQGREAEAEARHRQLGVPRRAGQGPQHRSRARRSTGRRATSSRCLPGRSTTTPIPAARTRSCSRSATGRCSRRSGSTAKRCSHAAGARRSAQRRVPGARRLELPQRHGGVGLCRRLRHLRVLAAARHDRRRQGAGRDRRGALPLHRRRSRAWSGATASISPIRRAPRRLPRCSRRSA